MKYNYLVCVCNTLAVLNNLLGREHMAENNLPVGYPEEEMTVELKLDDGRDVMCEVITILEVGGLEYVVLAPKEDNPLEPEQEVWFYKYSENPDDPNEEPVLSNIEDDLEYEIVLDAFEEYMDNQYFDEI